jgi:hypothetical protein
MEREERPEEKEIITYSYMKDGVRCHTPYEDLAALRSDDGEYQIERTKPSDISSRK